MRCKTPIAPALLKTHPLPPKHPKLSLTSFFEQFLNFFQISGWCWRYSLCDPRFRIVRHDSIKHLPDFLNYIVWHSVGRGTTWTEGAYFQMSKTQNRMWAKTRSSGSRVMNKKIWPSPTQQKKRRWWSHTPECYNGEPASSSFSFRLYDAIRRPRRSTAYQ